MLYLCKYYNPNPIEVIQCCHPPVVLNSLSYGPHLRRPAYLRPNPKFDELAGYYLISFHLVILII